jgi:hypothetical protein
MKIKFFFSVVFVVVFSTGYSQSFHIGIKVGADLDKLQGQSFSNMYSLGYQAGVFAEIGLDKKWGIQPEVIFTQSNPDTATKFSEIYKATPNFSQIKLNYLAIPVLLKYKLSKMIALEAGPQFGLLMNNTENVSQNVKDAFKQGDMAIVGGVQLKILSFRVYGRYAVGLNNLNNIDNQYKWTSQSIQIGVGYAFF